MRLFILLLFIVNFVYAQDAIVSVSSQEQDGKTFRGKNVIDGDMTTRWASNFSDNQFLKIELPQVVSLDLLEIFWEKAYSKDFNVKISLDGENWETVYSETDKPSPSATKINLKGKELKFIYIDCLVRKTTYCHSIFEVKFNGEMYPNFISQVTDNANDDSKKGKPANQAPAEKPQAPKQEAPEKPKFKFI